MLEKNIFKGFFKPYYDKIRSSVDDETIKKFADLNNDEERIKFVWDLKLMDNINVEKKSSNKSLQNAIEYKNSGNKHFQENKYKLALQDYNKSVLLIPTTSVADYAIIIANRSAALYHLNEYRLALIDINVAIELDYPKEMIYKIQERKARCYLALKKNVDALNAFKETLTSLDFAKLPIDRKLKLQTDAQIMIGMLSKQNEKIKMKIEKTILHFDKTRNDILPDVSGKRNNKYVSASDSIEIKESSQFGRYAVAGKNITVGDTLVVEKSHCAVLLPDYALTHCQQCFIKVKAPIPCNNCADVIFCSSLCKKLAEYHNFECEILSTLWKSGASITCFMALRIITQNNPSFFKNIKTQLLDNNEKRVYKGSDYLRLYNLVCNEDKRNNEDFFQTTHMSIFLLKCLMETGYFQEENLTDQLFVGSLILRHIQLLQFNAHEIFELQMNPSKPNRTDLGKTIFLGGGVYPTLALFNHSCDPGIIRYFHGTSVIARAIKNISQGEIVAENYGPIYTETPIEERKRVLKLQYWFDCFCVPCQQAWPLFDNMDTTVMRFRCDSGDNCKNIIPLDIATDNFMIQCGVCLKYTNILKGLKALQDTDAMFKVATQHVENGETRQALSIFLKVLALLDETLAPPFKDYNICQQGIRRCLLDYGNKTIFE